MSGRGLFVGLIRLPEESYRVLCGVTITLYIYNEQAEEARLTEKENVEESNADKHQDTGQKSDLSSEAPDYDVVVKRDTLQGDQIVLLLTHGCGSEVTQQFLVYADEADLCDEYKCLNDG
jgi:hypothetical protein